MARRSNFKNNLTPLSKLSLAFACLALCLLPAPTGRAADAQLTVDLTQPGAPISPYLYGQFIEHLGRCIHDGVWAEKLRDRKFLLEPAKSPWKTVKPEGAAFDVFPDTAGAYAGDHCLALWLRTNSASPCGIRQGDLGLVAGKDYVGYAILAHADGAPAPVEIRLAWGDSPGESQSVLWTASRREYQKCSFRFRAGATTDAATLSVLFTNRAQIWLACLSLMPADNVKGMRADTLQLIKQLAPPITRWPGGNFVSGYNWKDGIGDRDRRPPRWERAWSDVEDNDFGIDEFMTFCAIVGTEPYIAVNAGLGSVQDAADEVQYATGSSRTRWGRERAKNGHAAPYPVTWWGIGNEMYGDWQLGNVSVERYAIRHNAFAAAMKSVNPKIQVIGVGAPGKWNDVVLPRCASSMSMLSGHHYTERKFRVPFSAEDAAKFEQNFPAYSGDVAAGVRRLVSDFRSRRERDYGVRLAVDEWGIVRDWNATPDGPGVGAFEHYYTLGDMIATGRALHELLRSAEVVGMANWAQTVNVIGAIKTSRNGAVLDPVGHLLALYRAQVGGTLVPASVAGDVPVDAVAAWDQKSGRLAIGLINFSAKEEVVLPMRLDGATRMSPAKVWRINGPNLGATNVPGQPETVKTTSLPDRLALDQPIRLEPHSITVLSVEKVRVR